MSDNGPPAADVASNGDEGNSPLSSRRRSLASPWASVVRGDSEQNSSPVAPAVSVSPGDSSSPPPSEQASGSGNSLTENSGSDAPPESTDVNGDGNAGRQRRPAWNRPVNGVVEPVSVMGGAVSWPALSETTRPVSRSLLDNSRPVSDGSVSASQAPILTQTTLRPVNDNVHTNSAVNNLTPTRPRSRNRNGGSSPGIGPSQNTFNQPPIQMPPPFPYGMVPAVLDTSVRGTRPVGGLGGSSHNGNDHSQRNNSRRGGSYGGRPRGDGQYNNNHGGRRDQGRRDVHHPPSCPPPPPPIGYIPSHLPPGVPPFIAPPPVRVFPGQMGFDMASPFIYYPSMPPESFRPMPIVSPPPGPPPFPAANENAITNMILKQIDFYFSDDNLVKDNYLRSKMDDQGWVSIALIANFRRVQQLTNDIPFILESLRHSTVVEVQGEKVRRRDDWRKWLPQFELLNSDSSSQTRNLETYLKGVSLDDTTSNANNNEAAMEGHSDMTSGRAGQSGEEAHAISV